MLDFYKRDPGNRLYRIWYGMHRRCENTKHIRYKRYGERGITVCPEWKHFKVFVDWALGHGYSEELTIDRIDSNKGYSPDNCRWATKKEQTDNRECTNMFTYKGQTHTLTEWACIYGHNEATLWCRIYRYGFSFEEAIKATGDKRVRMITYNGKTQNLRQWADELHIPYSCLKGRLNKDHLSVKEAFEKPYNGYHWDRNRKEKN